MDRKIITSNVFPAAIWMACWEGYAEFGPRGFGDTEQDAIDDLTAHFPDDSAEAA